MTETRHRLLILGLGNPLYGDDGLGIVAVARLSRRFHIPDGVEVIDGGTLGLALIPCLERAEQAILLDAIAADAPAGALVRLEGRDVPPALPHRLSPHELGVADLLFGASLLDTAPKRLVLLGLVPQRLEFSVVRSDVIDARIDALVDAAVEEARQMGVVLDERESRWESRDDTHDAGAICVGRADLLVGDDRL